LCYTHGRSASPPEMDSLVFVLLFAWRKGILGLISKSLDLWVRSPFSAKTSGSRSCACMHARADLARVSAFDQGWSVWTHSRSPPRPPCIAFAFRESNHTYMHVQEKNTSHYD
jgi:hypothetical protein